MKQAAISGTIVCKAYETDVPECRWIGECEELGIFVQANSMDELRFTFDEAMNLLITDLIEDEELNPFLIEKGWSKKDMRAIMRQAEKPGNALPWNMLVKLNSNVRQKAIA